MKLQVEFLINIPDKLRYLIHFKTSMHLLSTSSIDAKSSQLRIPILKYYELSSQSLSALLSSLSSSLNSGPPHQTAGLIGTQESSFNFFATTTLHINRASGPSRSTALLNWTHQFIINNLHNG